jgi:hypothetical protein
MKRVLLFNRFQTIGTADSASARSGRSTIQRHEGSDERLQRHVPLIRLPPPSGGLQQFFAVVVRFFLSSFVLIQTSATLSNDCSLRRP